MNNYSSLRSGPEQLEKRYYYDGSHSSPDVAPQNQAPSSHSRLLQAVGVRGLAWTPRGSFLAIASSPWRSLTLGVSGHSLVAMGRSYRRLFYVAWEMQPSSHSEMPVESEVQNTEPMPTDRYCHGESGLHCTQAALRLAFAKTPSP